MKKVRRLKNYQTNIIKIYIRTVKVIIKIAIIILDILYGILVQL